MFLWFFVITLLINIGLGFAQIYSVFKDSRDWLTYVITYFNLAAICLSLFIITVIIGG